MTAPATTVDNSVLNTAVMVPPKGGQLRVGNPGNRGGHGRRPDRIKKLAQQLLEPRLRLLAHFADGVVVSQVEDDAGNAKHKLHSPTPAERTKALEVLHKIGMGDTVSVSDVRDRLKRQVALIRSQETWTTDDLLTALGGVWK
jgi:hypothetical protein